RGHHHDVGLARYEYLQLDNHFDRLGPECVRRSTYYEDARRNGAHSRSGVSAEHRPCMELRLRQGHDPECLQCHARPDYGTELVSLCRRQSLLQELRRNQRAQRGRPGAARGTREARVAERGVERRRRRKHQSEPTGHLGENWRRLRLRIGRQRSSHVLAVFAHERLLLRQGRGLQHQRSRHQRTDSDGYYANATMSRLKPCNSGGLSGTAFDNDTTRNTSLPSTFVLTAGSNYTCQTTNASGAVVGELDWNASTRILQVRGTVFIDGNVSIDGVVKYRGVNSSGTHPAGTDGSDGEGGMMVMYVSGTVSMSNTGVFCGWNMTNDTSAYSSGSCDFNAWTPTTSMFMFIAGGGVTLNQGSYFQGAIFTAGSVSLGQSAQTEGPIIAG